MTRRILAAAEIIAFQDGADRVLRDGFVAVEGARSPRSGDATVWLGSSPARWRISATP